MRGTGALLMRSSVEADDILGGLCEPLGLESVGAGGFIGRLAHDVRCWRRCSERRGPHRTATRDRLHRFERGRFPPRSGRCLRWNDRGVVVDQSHPPTLLGLDITKSAGDVAHCDDQAR